MSRRIPTNKTSASRAVDAAGATPADDRRYPRARPAMRGKLLIRNPVAAAAISTLDAALGAGSWRRPPMPADPRRILLCNWAHLGDVLLTLPAVSWLRHRFLHAEFGFLAGSWARPILDDVGGQFTRIHFIDPCTLSRSGSLPERLRRQFEMASAAEVEIRAAGYDLAIDFYPFFPGAGYHLWRAGVPVRVGWTSGGLGPFYTHRVRRIDADRHVIDYQRDILAKVDPANAPSPGDLRPCYPRDRPPPPPPPPLDDGRPYVLIHTGTRQPTREWREDNWTELARRISAGGMRVVLLGSGPREAARNAAISAAVPGVVDLTGVFDWAGLVGVIERCEALYCLESVAGHIAAVFDRPVTVIYGGMTNPRQWAPLSSRAVTVTFPTPCAPCNRAGCAGMYCIAGVDARSVLSASGRRPANFTRA